MVLRLTSALAEWSIGSPFDEHHAPFHDDGLISHLELLEWPTCGQSK